MDKEHPQDFIPLMRENSHDSVMGRTQAGLHIETLSSKDIKIFNFLFGFHIQGVKKHDLEAKKSSIPLQLLQQNGSRIVFLLVRKHSAEPFQLSGSNKE